MTTEQGCVFCEIVANDPREQVFYRDEHVVAFLDLAPAAPGHALVVPRRHDADVFDASAESFAALAGGVHAVAALLRDQLRPEGLTILQSNGAAAWQDVAHLHVHLIPRSTGDTLVPPWTPPSTTDADAMRLLTSALRRRAEA